MENLERIIAEHPFFAGLDSEFTKLMVSCASNVRFKAGTYILKEGDPANTFYLIREGKVAVEVFAPQRKPIIVATLSVGELLGWSWLLPPFQWKFHARALQNVRAIALDGKCLRTKCEENHDLGYAVLKRFAQIMEQRLEATRLQLLDVYSVSMMTADVAIRRRSDAHASVRACATVAKETPDTFTLTIEPDNGKAAPRFTGTVQHALGVWSGRVTHLDQR